MKGNHNSLAILFNQTAECVLCPRMHRKQAVLSDRNGPATAEVMFIAEAPGRFGADRTRVPLSGDATGRNFEALLEAVGISRGKAFITNAVLCNPINESGVNSRPTEQEIKNCSEFLMRQIELVNPRIVVTLGEVALGAVNCVFGLDLRLRSSVGQTVALGQRLLIPLYHPSPRVLNIHRKWNKQIKDYQVIAAHLKVFPD